MNTAAAPFRPPLVPEDMNPVAVIPHAAWAAVRAAAERGSPAAMCTKLFPRDPVALAVLTRAAISGASTAVPSWAGVLAQRAVGEWLGSLVPISAAAELIRRGLTVSVTEGTPLGVPVRATAPTSFGWVGEGAPIPMRAWAFAVADLNPKKLAVIVAFSRELSQNSNASQIFEAVLREESALTLDAAYFGTQAGSASAHAGLLNGLVAGTGSADMAADLAKLAGMVGAGGSGQTVFVTAPGRSASAAVRLMPGSSAVILPSLAVPEGRCIGIDPLALVHGFDGAPDIAASQEPLLHMEDTAPLQIASGTQGSGVLATPAQSMFQVAMISMRAIVDVAFAVRRSGAVAYLDGCTW
jgi:hypothetical protein